MTARLLRSFLALLAMACATQKAPEPARRPARVIVETRAGAVHPVRVELARTDAERAQGLMNRSALADDAGMLFVFEQSARHGFWMKNTFIPLDLIFIDDAWRIVGIIESAQPGSLETRSADVPSRYVLEVNGGWAAARGVRPGDVVRFENVF